MSETTIAVTTRNLVGRAIYRLGAALCGLAGWWDAGTDQCERRHENGSRCTGNPCICTNGIGCVTVPVEDW